MLEDRDTALGSDERLRSAEPEQAANQEVAKIDPSPDSLLLSDLCGHPFTFELAADLARRGFIVDYSYCPSFLSPRAAVDASAPMTVHPVTTGRAFDKYRWTGRLMSELRYGFGTARVLWRTRPGVHVACTTPLLSLAILWVAARLVGCRTVIWLQDVQSGLAGGMLGSRHPLARALTALERFLLRRSDRVIAISGELAGEAERLGARPSRIAVLENWAPIEQLPVRPKANDWSREHHLDNRTVLLYSGTLARKHSPDLIVDLADAVADDGATVVVVSEGEGSEWLHAQQRLHPRTNLILLPYQPFSMLPDVLGSADILIVLLNPEAAGVSVPSKTLSYLCSGRAILASIAATNAAATTIDERARAGIVIEPDDRPKFLQEAKHLVRDSQRRDELGRNGRAYAEAQFGRDVIARRFFMAAEMSPTPNSRLDSSAGATIETVDHSRRGARRPS